MQAATKQHEDVVMILTERFERRLTEETSRLRQEMVQMRSDTKAELSALREDMAHGLAGVRVEIIKWSFAFCLAQIVTIATLFLRAK